MHVFPDFSMEERTNRAETATARIVEYMSPLLRQGFAGKYQTFQNLRLLLYFGIARCRLLTTGQVVRTPSAHTSSDTSEPSLGNAPVDDDYCYEIGAVRAFEKYGMG
jgi:hypothetical protein